MTVQNNTKKPLGSKPFSKINSKLLMLAGCGIVGVLLLLYGGGRLGGGEKSAAVSPERHDLSEYSARLEDSIERLCSSVAGVSNVTVAVTLKSGFEYVYATNTQMKTDGSTDVKYLTIGSGGREGTIYITEKLPEIAGIGIVCRGGSDPAVVQKLISLISAAYGVGANKIYITGT